MTIYEGKWVRLVSSGEVYSVRVGTKLGEWIAGQMNRFGLSVRVLSEELGVSYSTVYSMLRGKKGGSDADDPRAVRCLPGAARRLAAEAPPDAVPTRGAGSWSPINSA